MGFVVGTQLVDVKLAHELLQVMDRNCHRYGLRRSTVLAMPRSLCQIGIQAPIRHCVRRPLGSFQVMADSGRLSDGLAEVSTNSVVEGRLGVYKQLYATYFL